MNDKFTNNTNPENEPITQKLSQVAEHTNVNSQFAAELEERLRNAHQPKASWFATACQQISPTLRWTAMMILLGLILSWSIKTLIPAPQPFSNSTPGGFVCPVTQPNGSLPPGTQPSETTNDPNLLGNGELWTVLRPGGKIFLSSQNQRTDGSFETVWPWYRGVEGQLTIEGHRLDADTEPLRAELPEGFNNFQSSTLIFPTTGCWEITGRVGNASLTFVSEVLFDAAIPTPTVITTPNLVTDATATPIAEGGGYDWRGTKLYLAEPLPESPGEANVYLLQPDQLATVDEARALAERFGLGGEIYQAPNYILGTTDYFFTDGKQSLSVSSNLFFTYIADMAKAYNYFNNSVDPNAESTIEEFLQSHGFDFPHQIRPADLFDGYMVEPLSPDGFPMRYEYFSSRPMRVTLDNDGQVLRVEANLMSHERSGTQTYGVISAEEAFQKILNQSSSAGQIESANSSSQPVQEWKRIFPTNETITIYGYVSSIPALDSSKPHFLQVNGYTVTGNTAGMEGPGQNAFVEATGQFVNENGIETFRIESWKVSELSEEAPVGTLQQEGAQVVLVTAEGNDYILPDVPADVPIPFENAFVIGVKVGDLFQWTLIDNRMSGGGGGGGGGGGLGFYKLNLSGTPVPFPSPTTQPEINQGNSEYIVKEGDTLFAIAEAYGITPEKIFQANNNLSEERVLVPGMRLIIPGVQTNSASGQYTVQEGDTLVMIAQNFGITVDELMQANGLNDPMIFIGQILIIPGAQSPSQNPLIGKRFEDQRGIFVVNIYRKPDGSQRTEYTFITSQENAFYYLILEGDNLQELEKYHNRPVNIWATIEKADQFGTLTAKVDRFEVPFPDLQIQILRGTQKTEIVADQPVQLFTTEDGKTYVELMLNGNVSDSLIGSEGNGIIHEALIIPDETYGGYPTIRIFSSSMAVNPKSSEAVEMTVTADQPYIMDEIPDSGQYAPPPATIERVDLIYYVTNQHWQVEHLDGGPQYIQPAWRFYGHYSNGDEFEILVQALKQEYLLPELAPYIQGG